MTKGVFGLFGHQPGLQQKMTETENESSGGLTKVVVIRGGPLDSGVLEAVPLVRGVLGVVGRLLEVPSVVVFPLGGKIWFRKERENSVEIRHL